MAAETVYLLESFDEAPREQVARALRSILAFPSVTCVDPALLLRALEVYETVRIDFAEAYLVACAETTGVRKIVSFDSSLHRVTTVERLEPSKAWARPSVHDSPQRDTRVWRAQVWRPDRSAGRSRR